MKKKKRRAEHSDGEDYGNGDINNQDIDGILLQLPLPDGLDDALMVFHALVDDCPDFTEAHNKLATLLFLMGQYDEAVKECEEVLQRIPHHFGALNGLGMCLYELKRFEQAIVVFQRALEIQPYAQINRTYIARCRASLN